MKQVAAGQPKAQRLKAIALLYEYADADNLAKLAHWLDDWFPPEVQSELFDCGVNTALDTITPGEKLMKVINTLRKR